MDATRTWQCPTCTNFYSAKFASCPECETPLQPSTSRSQQIEGKNNQAVIINGPNTGAIIHQPAPAIAGAEIAHYQFRKVQHYGSVWQIYRPWLWSGGIATGTGLLSLIGDSTSILSFLGITPSGLFNPGLIHLICVIVGLIAVKQLLRAIEVRNLRWFCRGDRLYMQDNLEEGFWQYRVEGNCPAAGCAGTLHEETLPDNEEGIAIAAVCSLHRHRHVFELNPDTGIGGRLQFTIKREPPKP
ncbi:MAG: hypothetical protein ACOY3E_10735 [Pseudomonadota bacterium]